MAVAQIQSKKIIELEAKILTLTQEDEITKANKDLSLAQQIKFSNILNAILCVFFMISTILVIIATIGICIGRIKIPLKESAYIHVDSLKKA